MTKKVLFLETTNYCPLPDIYSLRVASDGCDVICLSDIQSAYGVMNKEKNLAAFVSNHPSHDLFNHLIELHPTTSKILVTDQIMSDYSRYFKNKEEHLLDHIITNFDNDRWIANDLRVTLQKIIRSDILGLDRYLLPDAPIFSRKVTGTKDRENLNSEVMQYAENLKLGSSISKLLFGIVEELVMNAVYDAPKAAGRNIPSTIRNMKTVVLGEADQSELSFGFDGEIFAVSLRDPFGALEKEKFFTYLKKVLNRDNSSKIIDEKKGGAGLGLFKILYSSHALICNVIPGSITEVIALIATRQQIRDFSKSPRTIHFFSHTTAHPTASNILPSTERPNL